ncbi:MAG: hypothetical protein KUL85_16650 [Sphingobacterium mizutaii]|nr:hypothetical protein [Sphingobacterium mizutaii]
MENFNQNQIAEFLKIEKVAEFSADHADVLSFGGDRDEDTPISGLTFLTTVTYNLKV